MNYLYSLYGLIFQLPFCCPILPEAPKDANPDVQLNIGHVPLKLDDPIIINDSGAVGYCWEASLNQYLLIGGDYLGRFLVENGNKITFEYYSESNPDKIIYHLLHSVLAAVLRQRGILTLHANVAGNQSGALAISGSSGSGKSTTLAALIEKGYQMISDDITVLNLTSDGQIHALCGLPQTQLCFDAVQQMGLDPTNYARSPVRQSKIILPISNIFQMKSAPLKTIYLLERSSKREIEVIPLTGVEKFIALQSCIYGPLLPEQHPHLFNMFSTIINSIRMFRILRPEDKWSLDKVVAQILKN